jgi:hypothetical protein
VEVAMKVFESALAEQGSGSSRCFWSEATYSYLAFDPLSPPPAITSFNNTTQALKERRSPARWYIFSRYVQNFVLICLAVGTKFGGDSDTA